MEYELSDLATTLLPHAVALADWAIEHKPAIDAHREVSGNENLLSRTLWRE